MSANEKHALHSNDSGTHVNAHDFTSVNFTTETNELIKKLMQYEISFSFDDTDQK